MCATGKNECTNDHIKQRHLGFLPLAKTEIDSGPRNISWNIKKKRGLGELPHNKLEFPMVKNDTLSEKEPLNSVTQTFRFSRFIAYKCSASPPEFRPKKLRNVNRKQKSIFRNDNKRQTTNTQEDPSSKPQQSKTCTSAIAQFSSPISKPTLETLIPAQKKTQSQTLTCHEQENGIAFKPREKNLRARTIVRSRRSSNSKLLLL